MLDEDKHLITSRQYTKKMLEIDEQIKTLNKETLKQKVSLFNEQSVAPIEKNNKKVKSNKKTKNIKQHNTQIVVKQPQPVTINIKHKNISQCILYALQMKELCSEQHVISYVKQCYPKLHINDVIIRTRQMLSKIKNKKSKRFYGYDWINEEYLLKKVIQQKF